jgi:hypothetical protein
MTVQKFPKIEEISLEEILKGERMGLQISTEVLKKSEQKAKNQSQLF